MRCMGSSMCDIRGGRHRYRHDGPERCRPHHLRGQGAALPDFQDFWPRPLHGLGAWFLLALLALHAGAALYHHFGRHDGLLRRMWVEK